MPIPRFIAGFNKHVTNKIILIFAGWLPPFAVISHVGRRSGRVYRTPVLAFKSGEGYVVALTYGRDVDWVRNLLSAGSGEVERGGLRVPVSSFRVASYVDKGGLFPLWVRLLLSLISVKDCLYMEKTPR
jgi:deazaflavin-dependent oxidoreductase (nitroreductase family)